jgi:hypothetical protein
MNKVKIVDLPLGVRFKFDLAGGVWVLLDKGLRGTCILEDCKTCSPVNVAETVEAFANMEVFNVMRDVVEAQQHFEEDTTIRHAEFGSEKMQPPTFSSGFREKMRTFDTETWKRFTSMRPGGVVYLDNPKPPGRQQQAIEYIKSSSSELLKEADNLNVEVRVHGAESYMVYAK